MRWLAVARATNWKLFFNKNGVRTWKWTKDTAWRESPNEMKLVICVYGVDSVGNHFCAYGWADPLAVLISRGPEAKARYLEDKKKLCIAHLELFLRPDCRCRVGYHWKCGVHRTWVG